MQDTAYLFLKANSAKVRALGPWVLIPASFAFVVLQI